MVFETLYSPTRFLQQMLGDVPHLTDLQAYEAWWEAEGRAISAAVDRAGTPWLRQHDRFGTRVDDIGFPPDYWRMLRQGYKAGATWRAFDSPSLAPSFLVGYVAGFYDTGLYCPYTVSLSTAVPLAKYGTPELKDRFLTPLLRRDDTVWQGATWMTEIRGGSDLGANVDTVARPDADGGWRLTGDKYFTSNAGAEVAVVAARVEGGQPGVRGLALFLLPRRRADGSLNYHIRRLKDKIATRSVPTGEIELRDSEAYLLGRPEWGIYLILEVLNLSRVANSMGSVALAQRALADALAFAERRVAFGKPIIEHALLRRQFEKRVDDLRRAFALAWESVRLADTVRAVTPPYPDAFHLCRLVIHLAKYYTAEVAVQTAKWAIEVNGGLGTLAEYGVERWLREAMIVDVWEGPPHRQILDGLEVMERKGAHKLLWEHLDADPGDLDRRLDAHLALPPDEKEAGAQEVFEALADFTARALLEKHVPG